MALLSPREQLTKTFQTFDPEMWAGRAEGGYHQLGWVKNQALLNFIAELADLDGDETMIDVASGSGAVARALATQVEQVHAADISPAMLKDAQQEMSGNVTFTVGSAAELPYASNSADLVTARMVYHHLPDTVIPRAIAEAYRVAKPGGKIILIEYTPPNEEAQLCEREVFEIKESGRHLWTVRPIS